MMRDLARLNFEGKLQTAVEERGQVTHTLSFGAWQANRVLWKRQKRHRLTVIRSQAGAL